MDETSSLQSAFLKKHRQHHHLVLLLRLFGCILFLGLWEISTRLSWIDSFIFSSPSGDIGQFSACHRHQFSDCHSSLDLSNCLRDTGTLAGSSQQSSKICTGTASNRMAWKWLFHHHCCRHVCRCLWQHNQHVYCISRD